MSVQAGDLILYPVVRKSQLMSKLIGWGQKLIGQAPGARSYSHVAVVGPDLAHQYEAWFPYIRNTAIRLEGAEVYRLAGITPDAAARMMSYCRSQVGRRYDWLSIVSFGIVHLGGMEVCSELAYFACLSTGLVQQNPAFFESPDDVAAMPELVAVENPCASAIS